MIDTTFNFHSDSKGGDPDCKSPTLRRYHKTLWSKQLPTGHIFELTDTKKGAYLYHKSSLGEFFLGSDAISHSYRKHKRKVWLTQQIPEEVQELFHAGSTIGGYTLFPSNRIDNQHTINQARGVNRYIDDRFDLTLECIRLFYADQPSPLYLTLLRYKDFFDLFLNFEGYVNFFLLNDLVDKNGHIRFYLPFDQFKTSPAFTSLEDYLMYKDRVMAFVKTRNRRIVDYVKQLNNR